MEERKDVSLPKPELDLPLPEKELPSGETSQTETSSSEPKEEKSGRGMRIVGSFIFGFLFVVILAAIGGAFILGMNKSTTNKQTVTTQISAPSPTTNPTANWQTYTGEGFNFKYPTSLFLFDCSSTFTPKGVFVHLVTDKTIDCNEPLTSSQNIVIINEIKDFNEAQNVGKLNERDEETVNIDGKTYTMVTGSKEISGAEGEKISSSPIEEIKYVLVPYKNTNLLIGYYRISQVANANTRFAVQKDLSEDFKHLLSTLRFTNTSPAPTCRPRPSCLDSEPRCMIAETADMCPPTPKLSPSN